MKKRNLLALLLAGLTCFSLVGCGGGNNSGGGSNNGGNNDNGGNNGGGGANNGKKIVIYAGGSSEYSWVKGSAEEEVINEIEQAYYDDTGILLDFEVSYLGQDMKTKLGNELGGGSQVDIAISHTGGGDGIDDYLAAQNWYYNLDDLLYRYGKNILPKIEGNALDRMTTVERKVVGFPSVINPQKYGILVRKDWMNACGYTDDPTDTTKTYVGDLETFEAMCLAMKSKYNLNYVVTAAPWDLEKVITLGAFGDAGYFSYAESGGKVVPGFATPEYKDVLKTEYEFANKGITARASASITLSDGEKEFVGGATGVFVVDPTVQHLIQVARRTKTANPEAEFAVLGALTKDKSSTKKGFMRNTEATFAACVTSTSKNAVDIVKFVNWMYSDVDNYNLCKYGIEGEHWIDNGDGTYSYPEGKESYLVSPPYSGILALVENQNVSNMMYKGYTDEEKSWIATAAKDENYIDNDLVNYMWTVSAEIKATYNNAILPIYNQLASPAWSGSQDPTSAFDSYRNNYLNNLGKSYVDAITNDYQIMKSRREQ